MKKYTTKTLKLIPHLSFDLSIWNLLGFYANNHEKCYGYKMFIKNCYKMTWNHLNGEWQKREITSDMPWLVNNILHVILEQFFL